MDIYEDQKGRLLFLFQSSVLSDFDFETDSIGPLSINNSILEQLKNEFCIRICEDNIGRLWIATYGAGVYIYDQKTNSLIHIDVDTRMYGGLSDGSILSLYKDRGGSIILGTNGRGVNVWHPNLKKFRLLRRIPDELNTMGVSSVRAVYEDRNKNLWIGGYTGLDKYSRETGRFTHFEISGKNPVDSSSVSVPILIIREDPEEPNTTLWIGMENWNLVKFDLKTETNLQFPLRHETTGQIRTRLIRALFCDESGLIWIGTQEGLFTFDKTTEKFSLYKSESGRSLNNSITVIQKSKLEYLWIGTSDRGLFKLELDTDLNKNYVFDQNQDKSDASSYILSLHEDQTGVLWIGTHGQGLIRFEISSGKYRFYSKSHGLPNNVVYGILEDENENLWLSTNKGLSRFDSKEETFTNYSVEDGLQSLEFNYNAYYKSRSGEMFFGGVNGLNAFYPSEVKPNPFIPPVVITNFQIFNNSVRVGEYRNGKIILKEHVTTTEAIRLSHKEKVISFEYAALQFAAPEKSEYAHILEGLETEWNYMGNRRYASYSNLAPGNYTFRVKATNNDGLWNETGTSLDITITPPFWSTWWFRLLVIAGFLFLTFLWYEIRTQQIKKRSKQLETINLELTEQIAERMRAEEALKKSEEEVKASLKEKVVLLQEIHHRVKNNMQIISSLLRLQSGQIQNEEMQDIFRISQDRIRSMALIHDMFYRSEDFAEVDFAKYVGRLVNYLKKTYISDANKLEIQTHLEDVFLDLNTAVPCGLILNELITNAMNHAFPDEKEGIIYIKLRIKEDKKRELLLSDNGVGFPPDINFENPKTLGLTLVNNLVNQMGATIECNSDKGVNYLITF